MSSLHRVPAVGRTAALSYPSHARALQSYTPRPEIERQPEPVRPTLMRRYECSALLPDLTIAFNQHVAPATPLFEECATALARGTLVQTLRGEMAIEDLMPGDYIETANGSEPITWIGSTNYVPGTGDEGSSLTHLTRIMADRFGGMDVMVGPAARMVYRHAKLDKLLGQGAVLAPVADFIDGDRIIEVNPGGTVQMFHLMVGNHTTFKVGGLEIETYHPGKAVGQDLSPKMRALFLSMFPNITDLEDFGQVSLTRTTRKGIDGLLDS